MMESTAVAVPQIRLPSLGHLDDGLLPSPAEIQGASPLAFSDPAFWGGGLAMELNSPPPGLAPRAESFDLMTSALDHSPSLAVVDRLLGFSDKDGLLLMVDEKCRVEPSELVLEPPAFVAPVVPSPVPVPSAAPSPDAGSAAADGVVPVQPPGHGHALRPRRGGGAAAAAAAAAAAFAAVPTREECTAAAESSAARRCSADSCSGRSGHSGDSGHSRSSSLGGGSDVSDVASVASAASAWSGGESTVADGWPAATAAATATAVLHTAGRPMHTRGFRTHGAAGPCRSCARLKAVTPMKAVRSDKKKRGGWVINNKDLLAKITPKERQALAADAKKQKRRFRGIVPPPLGTSPAALSKEQVKGLRWALRRLRNVDSAKTSRANRKKELDELRDENSLLWDENDELTDENASLLVQLDRLRSMLGGGGGGAVMMIAAFVGIGLGGLGDSAGDAGVNISLGPAADPADGFQARTLLAADADHAECVVPAVGDATAAPDGFFAGSTMLWIAMAWLAVYFAAVVNARVAAAPTKPASTDRARSWLALDW